LFLYCHSHQVHGRCARKGGSVARKVRQAVAKNVSSSILVAGLLARFLLVTLGVDRDVLSWLKTGQQIAIHGLFSLYSFRGSGYRYPPLWSLACALAYFLHPATDFHDDRFLFLIKSPLIIADTLTFFALTRLVRRRRGTTRAVLAGILYFLNPFVIYVGAYGGFFDPLAVMFLVLTIYFLHDQDLIGSGLTASLAALTKQYSYPVISTLFVLVWKREGPRKALSFMGLILLIFGGVSLPFFIHSGEGYIRAIFYSAPGPIRRSCTGLWSLLWNLERHTPYEVISWLPWLDSFHYYVFYGTISIPLLAIIFSDNTSESRACLLSSLCFLCFSPQVHSQYLILFIPFLIIEIIQGRLHPFWYTVTMLPMIFQALPKSWQTRFIVSTVLFLTFLALLTQIMLSTIRRDHKDIPVR